MACLINAASQAEMDSYRAYVAWLKEAQRIRLMFLEADLSLPHALEVLFRDTKKKSGRKRITK